ncbi:MAG: hypothetical protein ACI9AB_002297, partial [Urechidicola sp.]
TFIVIPGGEFNSILSQEPIKIKRIEQTIRE